MEYDLWAGETFVDFSPVARGGGQKIVLSKSGRHPEGKDRKPFLKVELQDDAVQKVTILEKVDRNTDTIQILRKNALVLKVLSLLIYNPVRQKAQEELVSIKIDTGNESEYVTFFHYPRLVDGGYTFKYNRKGDMVICSHAVREIEVLQL